MTTYTTANGADGAVQSFPAYRVIRWSSQDPSMFSRYLPYCVSRLARRERTLAGIIPSVPRCFIAVPCPNRDSPLLLEARTRRAADPVTCSTRPQDAAAWSRSCSGCASQAWMYLASPGHLVRASLDSYCGRTEPRSMAGLPGPRKEQGSCQSCRNLPLMRSEEPRSRGFASSEYTHHRRTKWLWERLPTVCTPQGRGC